MADESRRWVIEITGDLGEIGEKKDNKKKKSPLSNLQKIIAQPGQLMKSSLLDEAQDLYKSGHKISGTAAAAGIQSASALASIIKEGASANFERYCTLQEDYISQQAVSNIQSSINRLSQAGSSIISGAAQMSGFGAWGMLIGGVIGGVSFGVKQQISYQKRMSGYYQKLNATNFQTNFSASRAGLTNQSRGTEN